MAIFFAGRKVKTGICTLGSRETSEMCVGTWSLILENVTLYLRRQNVLYMHATQFCYILITYQVIIEDNITLTHINAAAPENF